MRIRASSRYLAPLGIALMLSLGACAAPAPAGSAGSAAPQTSGAAVTTGDPSSTAPGSNGYWVASGGLLPPSHPSTPPDPATNRSSTQTQTQAQTQTPASTSNSTSAAAASTVTSGPGVVVTPLPACRSEALKTLTAGKLTFTTDHKAHAPWFVGDPAGGQGYESAVAAAVARELGFGGSAVRWTTSDAARVTAGQATGFDVAVGEFPTPDRTASRVDYSTGYFSIADSVVARPGTPAARVTTLAGLRSMRVGAIPNTHSAGVEIASTRALTGFSGAAAGLAALRAGTVDAVVVPITAAIAAQASVTVVGQLSRPAEQPQQFGMILPKGSQLTSCVSAAIDQLRVTGALTSLLETWIPAAARPLR